MNLSNFFAELKRRNVYKVAVAYAVVSWLLIQAASILFPTFDAPPWVMKVFVVVLVLGFPIALVFSWAFEITPEGIRLESEIEPNKSITGRTGRKLVALTVGLAILAAGLMVFQFLKTRTNEVSPILPAATIPDKSIAVLPFENLSDDKSNAYFAEGIQDEILTRLSKIAALKVISRTSTEKYKSAPDNLREVGKQLGVANLLEGSVQKVSNAVHVNVQLIRAATDEHVWAESYNRKLDDVFAVEGEVASTIADQLDTRLSQSEQKAVTDKPTQNAAAYDAYLRGLSVENSEFGTADYPIAETDYAEAVRLDPKFALAWARLATVRSFLYFNRLDTSTSSADSVKQAADRAMALVPDSGECWVALGVYRYRVLRDFEGALAAYQAAQKKLPNSSYVLSNLGYVQRRLNQWPQAEISFKKAIELDPRDARLLSSMAVEFYTFLRRFDDALACANRALEISPDSEADRANKVQVLQESGRLNEAAQELKRIPITSINDWSVLVRVTQGMYERNYDQATQAVERKVGGLESNQPLLGFNRIALVQAGYCYKWAGMPDKAKRAFQRVVKDIQPTPDATVVPEANIARTQLALAYAGLGEKQEALKQAQGSIQDYTNDAVNQPPAEVGLAEIQAQLGEVDAAIAALPHLLQIPAGITVADLKFNPMWDPLRKDPRFQKFIQEKTK